MDSYAVPHEPIRTTVVGSHPFPGWLELADRAHASCSLASIRPPGGFVLSPDQKSAVFEWRSPSTRAIGRMNADGSAAKLLTHPVPRARGGCPCDSRPAFSPAGKRVAFVRTAGGARQALFVVNLDGTGLRRVTTWSNGLPGKVVWASGRPRVEP